MVRGEYEETIASDSPYSQDPRDDDPRTVRYVIDVLVILQVHQSSEFEVDSMRSNTYRRLS